MSGAPTTSCSPETARDALALSLVEYVGPLRYHELVAELGSPAHVLATSRIAPRAAAAYRRADEVLERAAKSSMQLIVHGSPDYPETLDPLRAPPPVLWAIGDVGLLRGALVGIVGTRVPTAYGERITTQLGQALARAGGTIVSGMARGIDGAAHRAALDVGAPTIAVLGTGADVAYPREHRALHREISRRGLVLSEYLPGAPAYKDAFPRRNRIIAALSRITIVVEAGHRSGALHTTRDAADLGRSVAGVPGPIDSPQSAGVNELLRDGAQVITCVDDALSLAGLRAPTEQAHPTDPSEAAIWQALAAGPLDLDSLGASTGLAAANSLVALTALELRGMIAFGADGRVSRR